MPFVNGFVNVSLAYRLIPDPSRHLSETTLPAQRRPGRRFKDVGVCLEKEPHVVCPIRSLTTFGLSPAFSALVAWAPTKLYGGLVSVMRPRVSTMSKRTVLTVRSFQAVS